MRDCEYGAQEVLLTRWPGRTQGWCPRERVVPGAALTADAQVQAGVRVAAALRRNLDQLAHAAGVQLLQGAGAAGGAGLGGTAWRGCAAAQAGA